MTVAFEYSDPLDGLNFQMTELRGLVTLVPSLIEADRDRRWAEIGQRPGDSDDEMIDVYEREAGPDEGWGHANYPRAVRSAALVTAWEIYRDFLIRELSSHLLVYRLDEHPFLAVLVERERKDWDRRFDVVKDRFNKFLKLDLSQLDGWPSVEHALELRNALIHNQGRYTEKYLKTKLAKRPSGADLDGFFISPENDQELIESVLIPLGEEFALSVINALLSSADEIRERLDQCASHVGH